MTRDERIASLEQRTDKLTETLLELYTALIGLTSFVDVLAEEIEDRVQGFPSTEELGKKVMDDIKATTDNITRDGKWNSKEKNTVD